MTIKRTMVAAAVVLGAAAMTGCSEAGSAIDDGAAAAAEAMEMETGSIAEATTDARRFGWGRWGGWGGPRERRDHRHETRREHRRHHEPHAWWRRFYRWWR